MLFEQCSDYRAGVQSLTAVFGGHGGVSTNPMQVLAYMNTIICPLDIFEVYMTELSDMLEPDQNRSTFVTRSYILEVDDSLR
jgi:hypothetical protein